jgi:hypothetical protein
VASAIRPEEYEEEAEFFTRTLIEVSDEPPRTILEVGSGGGKDSFPRCCPSTTRRTEEMVVIVGKKAARGER